jgi:hypothetical protein
MISTSNSCNRSWHLTTSRTKNNCARRVDMCDIIYMSLLVKLRNILIVLKLFYWFALKATIKGISRRDITT